MITHIECSSCTEIGHLEGDSPALPRCKRCGAQMILDEEFTNSDDITVEFELDEQLYSETESSKVYRR